MKTSVSPKGQATIPVRLREKYGIEPGSEIEWEENFEIGRIVVIPVKKKKKEESLSNLIKRAQKLTKGANLMKNYLKEKREEIRIEEAKFS